MYESPILISQEQMLENWSRELNKKLETQVIETIQLNYFIDINKEELIKALKYDREQYEKGYKDGLRDGRLSIVITAKPVKFYDNPYTGKRFTTCSHCDGKISQKDEWCKHCGAKMEVNKNAKV